jgi:hypothetical protein
VEMGVAATVGVKVAAAREGAARAAVARVEVVAMAVAAMVEAARVEVARVVAEKVEVKEEVMAVAAAVAMEVGTLGDGVTAAAVTALEEKGREAEAADGLVGRAEAASAKLEVTVAVARVEVDRAMAAVAAKALVMAAVARESVMKVVFWVVCWVVGAKEAVAMEEAWAVVATVVVATVAVERARAVQMEEVVKVVEAKVTVR